ncbi:hypothetical protein K458DRAFT_69303 [Lentithecium fluviatile CBS 122367]|uniref:Uncharacterized protein n=1 Tax=Lentithecium fluviatile CBS 122367 TaxID=1168545 RepID=A0A6G1JM61_9PLEO|nr:hypothetical protein K458DRAFT_69303 [Lentithecium fluviatile CBS 122367]
MLISNCCDLASCDSATTILLDGISCRLIFPMYLISLLRNGWRSCFGKPHLFGLFLLSPFRSGWISDRWQFL